MSRWGRRVASVAIAASDRAPACLQERERNRRAGRPAGAARIDLRRLRGA